MSYEAIRICCSKYIIGLFSLNQRIIEKSGSLLFRVEKLLESPTI